MVVDAGRASGGGPTWVTVVGPTALAVVPASGPLPVADVQASLGSEDPALAMARAVLRSGKDAGPMPPFALVAREVAGVRVLVRGQLEVAVSLPDPATRGSNPTGTDGRSPRLRSGGVEVVGSDGTSTWREVVRPAATVVEVRDGEQLVAVLELVALEAAVASGIGALAAAPEAEPEPEPEPEPESGSVTVTGWDPPVREAAEPSIEPSIELPVVVPPAEVAAPVEPTGPPAGAPATLEVPVVDPDPEPEPAPVAVAPADVDLSELFETRHGTSPVVPVVPVAAPAATPPPFQLIEPPSFGAGDDQLDPPTTVAPVVAAPEGPSAAGFEPSVLMASVQAVLCTAGHPNPPHAHGCRSCGGAIEDRAVRVLPRPVLGLLELDGAMVVEVDRPIVAGRRPSAEGMGGEPPRLVSLPDPEGALSRTHVELRIEGWEVLVVDRGSLNGTTVEVPGDEPVRLRPNEPFLLSDGSVITLAGELRGTFRTGGR